MKPLISNRPHYAIQNHGTRPPWIEHNSRFITAGVRKSFANYVTGIQHVYCIWHELLIKIKKQTFPEFVTPWAKHKPFCPSIKSWTKGFMTWSNNSFWEVFSLNTWLNEYSCCWSQPRVPDLKKNESLGALSSTFLSLFIRIQPEKQRTK